jgi:hypothetical protein
MYTTKYTLINGEEINWQFEQATCEIIEQLAQLYLDMTGKQPTVAFMDIGLYREWMHTVFSKKIEYVQRGVPTYPQIQTGVGPIIVYARLMSKQDCPLIVGNEIDLERNDSDRAFEDIVLAGCERECLHEAELIGRPCTKCNKIVNRIGS